MGVPPPPDFPAPEAPGGFEASAGVGFQPSPTGLELCGFAIPGFAFSLSFSLQLPDFDFPPKFFFAIALSCDLEDPLDAEVGFGGGREATDSEPDEPDE